MQFYMYSDEAIQLGHPKNFLFVVDKVKEDGYVVAWKCRINKQGIIHPAYGGLLEFDESLIKHLAFAFGQDTGVTPNTWFKPDSMYSEVEFDQLPKIGESV